MKDKITEFIEMYEEKYPNAESILTLFYLLTPKNVIELYYQNGEKEMYLTTSEFDDGGQLKFKP